MSAKWNLGALFGLAASIIVVELANVDERTRNQECIEGRGTKGVRC